MTKIGKYRVYYWPKDEERADSIPGWIVDQGEIGSLMSKHTTKADAIAAAKRYRAGDGRRMHYFATGSSFRNPVTNQRGKR